MTKPTYLSNRGLEFGSAHRDGRTVFGNERGGGAVFGNERGGGAVFGNERGGGAVFGNERGGGAVSGNERGGGTVLMAGVCAVTMILGAALVVVCGYLIAIHRARAVADLAALSGATAASIGGDPCAAARRNSTAQRASIDFCQRVGDQIDFLVTVTASVSIPIRLPGLPTRMAATAHAGAEDVIGAR